MPTTVQFRRGSTAQNDAFTGAAGELSIDTDLNVIRVHDNSTAGGEAMVGKTATQTLTNKTLTSAVLNTSVSGSAVLDEDDMSSNSATQLATQQSIKAYVDSQVTAQDLDVTSDSGTIAIDLDSETLTIAGGTGIDSSATSNTVTLAIDSTVTTLTGTQTLTNKTLTSPTINTGTVGTALTFNAQADARFADSDSSNWVAFQGPATIASNITWTLPNADGSSGQALVTNGSGTLSWAAAGATISSDTSTNTDFLLYFASSTSGALTAVNQDSGLTYNPSTGKITASAFAGALTGNVTGDVTGNADTATALATARTIAGNSFDGTANITIASTQLSDSADLARLAAPAFTGTATGVNLTLSGDLTVNGTTTTLATTNTVISDNLIELNNGAGSNANDSGIVIERGSTGDNAFIGWDESADKFIVGTTTATGASTGDLTISSGTLVASTFEGALSGNATTASAWQTARTLSLTGAVTGSASIDGSGDVSLATTNTADPVITLTGAVTGSGTMTNLGNVSIATTATADPTLTLAGDASGSATFTNLGNATLTVTVADDSHNHVTGNIDGLAEFISDTVGAMVTSNTESGISVTYDDTDNTLDFNVNDPTITLTGAVTGSATMTNLGNVSIATTATNDPTITLAGDLSGSATLTNLGSATLTATIVANSVALGTDTTGNYVGAGATSGNGISGSVSSEGGTFTVTSNATNANTASTIVFRDASGNFSAGTITANLTGNASGSSGSCTGNSATATTATNVTVSANNTTNETVYITFVDGATGTQGIETDTNLTYNPSTNVLSTTASSARYADLAEKYTSDADYDAGTVLVFGGDEEVTICTNKYDKRIAGIVSTDPAYLMNSEGEGATVALLGRVPCKVIGEIRKGDLMVASDIPGHAEAWHDESNPYIGSVIGKALENKTGAGADVIEVVVGRI